MEMATEASDLPKNLKKKVIEELKVRKLVLDDEKPIGKGAFGYVYRTRSTDMKELGACKVIVIPEDSHNKAKEDWMKSVEKEIGTLKILAGDVRIVRIRYSKVFPEYMMVGMEYCAGGSLEQYVNCRSGKTMDEFLFKSMAYQILSAMFDYSEQGIIHRNIKPENILIDEFGRLKISDFGLARDTYGQSKLSTMTTVGIKRYLSPELEDNVPQSIKSDVWAFGVVLLELAYGRDAFKTDKIYTSNPQKIISRFKKRGGYSIEMAQFLSRCFERENVGRASVEELLKEKWLRDVQVNTSTPVLESKSSPHISAVRSGNNN